MSFLIFSENEMENFYIKKRVLKYANIKLTAILIFFTCWGGDKHNKKVLGKRRGYIYIFTSEDCDDYGLFLNGVSGVVTVADGNIFF